MSRFPEFQKEHGAPAECISVPAEEIAKYRGKLPDFLLEEWQENGWCSYNNGYIKIVNPAEFDDVLQDWTPDASKSSVIVRTAFGDMFYWNDAGCHLVDVDFGQANRVTGNVQVLFDYLLTPGGLLEESLDYPNFKAALPRLGPPAADEVYGYVPAIGLGGPPDPNNLRRVKLREHLNMLSQLV